MRRGEIVLSGVVSFTLVARTVVDQDRRSVFAEDRQTILSKQYSLSSDPVGFNLRCARLAALSRCFSIRAISFCRF